MSKPRFGATSAVTYEAPVQHSEARAHNRSAQVRQQLTWRRLAAIGALLLVVGGTLVWLASQNGSTSSASQGLIGKPAPLASWRFPSSQGHPVSLAQERGKTVILFFYEGATCGSCQQELSLIQGILAKRHDTTAVAASVDPVSTSTNVAQQLKLTFPILGDTNHVLGSSFDDFHVEVAGMDMGEVDNHAVYVLDQKGVVRWAQQAPSTMWVSENDITAALNQV